LNQKEILELKRKGFSQKEIAEKLNITQQDVSYQLRKAKNEGLWNGESGNPQEGQMSFEGKKPAIKGMFRCSKCHEPIIAIKEVTFYPLKIGNTLREKGYTHVCVKCRIAFSRESSEISDLICPECNGDVQKIPYRKEFLYHCSKCRILLDEDELERGVE